MIYVINNNVYKSMCSWKKCIILYWILYCKCSSSEKLNEEVILSCFGFGL